MKNLTNQIIIHAHGHNLNLSIRKALSATSDALLEASDLVGIDLQWDVTSKTNIEAAFSKYVCLNVLAQDENLDETYIDNAFRILSYTYKLVDREILSYYDAFCGGKDVNSIPIKKSLFPVIKTGIGLFLLALHCDKVITLPRNYAWPTSRSSGARTSNACEKIFARSELISFVRSAHCELGQSPDPAFDSLVRTEKSVAWYLTNATRLIIALGWHRPEDVNLSEMLELRSVELASSVNASVSVQSTLLDTLCRKFGARCKVSPEDWTNAFATRQGGKKDNFKQTVASENVIADSPIIESDAELLKRIAGLKPSSAEPSRLEKLKKIAGTEFDLTTNASVWINAQKLYLKKVKKENPKAAIYALGLLNLYLFFYLPAWYKRNPVVSLKFPNTPNKLNRTAFISRIRGDLSGFPSTLMDFVEARQELTNAADSTIYGYIGLIESFFDFIEVHSAELEEAGEFRQVIFSYDYPSASRPSITNKSPIPRKIFGIFVAYVEELKRYIDRINEKILERAISNDDLISIVAINNRCVDTKHPVLQRLLGSSPYVELDEKRIEIRYLPYFPDREWYMVKNKGILNLIKPHTINQILAALYTGLRHNHIQWLDADRFDLFCEDEEDFSKLLVNTDKMMKRDWTPDVNGRVIEILRSQYRWRDLIEEPGFETLCYYNDNPSTSYQQFRPLFSVNRQSGVPHSDSNYAIAWKDILIGFQTWLNSDVLDPSDKRIILCKLVANGVGFYDPRVKEKLERYSTTEKNVCRLHVASEITPHSSRVSVVTNLTLTLLPPEIIGKRVTGQQVGTVAYYLKISKEDLNSISLHQAMKMQQLALNSAATDILLGQTSTVDLGSKAALINSNLAKSMTISPQETIARYGCISIMAGEETKPGVEIIFERDITQIAYNLTEICPYNNLCPDHIVKHISGFRRCSLCPAAIRCIDHLPAVVAAVRNTFDNMLELNKRIIKLKSVGPSVDKELEQAEVDRQRSAEELAGWQICENILEVARKKAVENDHKATWVVEKPEILIQSLQRIEIRDSDRNFILARLMEAISYPGFKNPKTERQFDMLRRRALFVSGQVDAALDLEVPADAAIECVGQLRSIVKAKNLEVSDVLRMLSDDDCLRSAKSLSHSLLTV